MKFINFLALPLLLFIWGDIVVLEAIKVKNFYPFGQSEGDQVVPPNDDGGSGRVPISFPFPFFGQDHLSLFINTNGVISFLTNVNQYTPDRFPLGDRRRLVAPFWADADTRVAGEVFYRETSDLNLLKKATADVTTIYVRCKSFRAAWLLIATWHEVAFYGATGNYTSKRNTFQAVLVTNGINSFVIFNYDKLTWTTGTASSGNSSGLGGKPAQAGFNGGDGLRYFNIPGSGTHQVLDLSHQSNVGIPGRWLYRIDSKAGDCNNNGTIKPCGYGQVYLMNQCVAAPAEFNRDFLGEPTITHYQPDQHSAEVALKCEVQVKDFIRSWTNVTYQITWYSEGKHLKTDNSICARLPAPPLGSTIIPDYDSPCLNNGRPLFSRLEGMEYKLNRLISCNVTARHFRSPLSPWCIPKTVGKPFFAGIKVSPSVLTVEECSDKEYTFSITPTIPVGTMPHTDHLKIGFFLPPKILLQNTNCNVEIRNTQTVTVRVIAQCTNSIKDATKIDKVIIPEIRNTHSGFWNRDMHLRAVWLSIKAANEIHYCGTYTDPHYQPLPVQSSSGSWDSRSSFTFMGRGDFALYKNTERNFEVHTRQWACSGSNTLVTCNCGVVLRDHNDVIEFNCCNEPLYFDQVTPIRVKVKSKRRLSPGISITQTQISSYVAYKVLFPSGVKVTVYRNNYGLNIELYTPRAKQRATESGLCLYDDHVEPDVKQYGYRFRLNHTESFFDVLPTRINDAGVRYDIPCSCDKQDEHGNPECKKELPTHYFNILDQQGRVVVPSGPGGQGREKRNVEDSDDLTDEDFDLFQRVNFGSGVHNRLRRAAPAISRFSKKNSTHYCRKLIADTKIGKSCAKVGSNVQALVNSCSIDLELTGDTSFALSAVTLLMNECGEIIGRNMSSYVNESGEEKPEIPPEMSEIVENLCPSDCTFNGRCVHRTCICNHGFTANDCSISIYQIPDISMLQGDGLCDKRKRLCKKVSVMGSGFLNSTNMTCHVKEFTVTNSSWTPKQTEIRTTGVMTDLALAECHLPESPVRPGYYHEITSGTPAAGLVISMSNDGEHKSSRNLTFISYDSACMTCNVTTGCVLKKNSCFINNYCFSTNEANPINWCQQCIPNMSERTWTKRQVNLPPQFLSTNKYFALSQEDLELGIDVSDPEGMPVTLTLTDGSPTKAVMRGNILLWNATDDANTRFSLKATDACGAVSTLNITVNLVACQCQNGSCVPHRNKPRGSGFYECNCIPGFTGAKCETNIDDCQSYPCLQGYCIDEVNQFKCVCNHGYVGKKCEIDYDDCGVSPCAHGNCTDYPGTYRCACDSGYGGQNCSIDIDECQSSPCRHGTCVDQINGYKCQCQPGYTGIDCDVDIDECQSSPCINGTCVNKVNGYNCVCQAGFNGTRCENNINECLLNSCGNGICVDKVNSYSCICNAGFTGRQCNVAITHCSSDSCYPGVPCTEKNGHIVCGPCPSGFTGDGKICKDINDCVNHTCQNGGSCVDGINNFTCNCLKGYTGSYCQTDINDCVNHTCQKGGFCVDGINNFTCNCIKGYTGSHCQTDINDCVNHTCLNGGSCVDDVNNYTCRCVPGFKGDRCEKNINDCVNHTCQNGGSCVDGINNFTCNCRKGYTGSHCQTDINDCVNHTCLNGGSCVDEVNNYTCRCVPGFKGDRCEKNINDCVNHTCQNGGSCVDGINNFTCNCRKGHTGSHCQTDINDCVNHTCLNGGSCVDDVNNYKCRCVAGFKGDRCEKNFDDCVNHTCLNGGSCEDNVNNYTCRCVAGFRGHSCEKNINDCVNHTCQNGGSCVDGINNFTCNCLQGYTGSYCQTDIDDCVNHPCLNGGSCIDDVNNYTCRCVAGFKGDHCETKLITAETSTSESTTPPSTREENVPPQTTTKEVSFEHKTEFTFEIRINEEWDNRLKDETSERFKRLSALLKDEILKVYSGNSELIEVEIVSLRPGSIIADFRLKFNTSVSADEALAPLKEEAAKGKLGILEVEPNSLKLRNTEKEEKQKEKESSSEAKLPLIIGVSCGVFVVIAVFTICLVYVFKWKRSTQFGSNNGVWSDMPADECNSRREKYELEVKYSKDKELILVEEKGISNEGMD